MGWARQSGLCGFCRVEALEQIEHGRAVRTPAYGAAYAEAFANGVLHVIPEAGHLPHIEQPEATIALIDAHLHETTTRSINTE